MSNFIFNGIDIRIFGNSRLFRVRCVQTINSMVERKQGVIFAFSRINQSDVDPKENHIGYSANSKIAGNFPTSMRIKFSLCIKVP